MSVGRDRQGGHDQEFDLTSFGMWCFTRRLEEALPAFRQLGDRPHLREASAKTARRGLEKRKVDSLIGSQRRGGQWPHVDLTALEYRPKQDDAARGRELRVREDTRDDALGCLREHVRGVRRAQTAH